MITISDQTKEDNMPLCPSRYRFLASGLLGATKQKPSEKLTKLDFGVDQAWQLRLFGFPQIYGILRAA